MRIQADIHDPRSKKRDLSEFRDLLRQSKNDIVRAVQETLPRLLANCETIANIKGNAELSRDYAISMADLSSLHDALIDSLVKSCRVSVTPPTDQNRKLTLSLVFKPTHVYEALNAPSHSFRVPDSNGLLFLAELARGFHDYTLRVDIGCEDADQFELNHPAPVISNGQRQPWLGELRDQSTELVETLVGELGELWTLNNEPGHWMDENAAAAFATGKATAMRMV
jgi:hypothetical protein